MQLGRPGLALRRGQTTALIALAHNERCCLLLKSFKKGKPGPETPGNLANVGPNVKSPPGTTTSSESCHHMIYSPDSPGLWG
jgi:hypothetical protein